MEPTERPDDTFTIAEYWQDSKRVMKYAMKFGHVVVVDEQGKPRFSMSANTRDLTTEEDDFSA